MYHEMTPFIVFICNTKRVHAIQTANNVAENLDFTFRIEKLFSYLLSFANVSSAKFMSALASFSNTKYFQCFVFPSNLNRLNTLSPYQIFAQIGNA